LIIVGKLLVVVRSFQQPLICFLHLIAKMRLPANKQTFLKMKEKKSLLSLFKNIIEAAKGHQK